MKSSFKTTTLIAAIGMIVYTTCVVTRHIIHELYPMPYEYDLWNDICLSLIFDILLVSFIIAGVGLLKNRPSNAASKSFRVFTICLFVALTGTLLLSPLYSQQMAGIPYLFPSIYWRAIVLISGMVWLFMLRKQPIENASPRSYRVTLILAMIMLAVPIVLEIISGISCIFSGHALLFFSTAIKSWVRWIAPTMVLTHFVFPQIIDFNATRNSHCMPGSYDERAFTRNRMITLVIMGIAACALVVGYFCEPVLRGTYFFHYYVLHDLEWRYAPAYNLCQTIKQISEYTFYLSLFVAWIMLSIMAFRQLPNSRGYKIYNVICQCLAIGNIIAAVIVAMYKDSCSASSVSDSLASVFFVIVAAFILTTTIRVISYSLPIEEQKM